MLPSVRARPHLAGDDNIRSGSPQRRRLLDPSPWRGSGRGFSSRHRSGFPPHRGELRHADDEMPGVFNPRRGQHRGVRRVAMDRVHPASRSVRTVSTFISITVGDSFSRNRRAPSVRPVRSLRPPRDARLRTAPWLLHGPLAAAGEKRKGRERGGESTTMNENSPICASATATDSAVCADSASPSR